MAKITAIPAACPDCGGAVWDNTKKPKRNPKAPDASCKDRDNCGWAGWLPDGAKTKAGGAAEKASRVQEYAWAPLLKLCVQYIQKEISPLWQGNVTPEMEKELASTLFIQMAKEGGDLFKKPLSAPPEEVRPPAPPPPPPPRRADYDDDFRDGLPF